MNNIISFFLFASFLILFCNTPSAISKELRTLYFELKYHSTIIDIEIHHTKTEHIFAERVEQIMRNDAPRLFDYFEHVPPGIIHFVINDEAKTANGMATVFPVNTIFLNNFPPTYNSHLTNTRDWIKGLVLHELAHIIHTDQTTGFMQFLRNIFGEIMKPGAVVPVWFLEGVAVWSESNFTNGGRLRNKFMKQELKSFLKQNEFCQGIDCLDEPGKFPFGQLPYWVGAYFLEHLEHQKKGTIRCLIKANSDSIPFFLNHAFIECTGKTAQKEFSSFKKSITGISKKERLQKERFSKEFVRYEIKTDGIIDWQKGYHLTGDKLLLSTVHDNIRKLAVFNLKSGKTKYHQFDKRIGQISQTDNFNTNPVPIMIFTFNPEGEQHKSWIFFDADKMKEIGSEIHNEYEYLFTLKAKNKIKNRTKMKIKMDYINGQWKISNEEKKLFQFPELTTIISPTLLSINGKEQIGLNVYNNNNNDNNNNHSSYRTVDPVTGKSKTIFSSSKHFLSVGTCHGDFIFKDDKTFFSVKNRFKVPWFDKLIDIKISNNKTIAIFADNNKSIYIHHGDCRKLLGKKSNLNQKRSNKIETKRPHLKKLIKNNLKSKSYPSLKHFIPHYWMINYSYASQLTYYQAFTSIGDPGKKQQLDLFYNYHPKIKSSAPVIDYQYNRKKFVLNMIYQKKYIWNQSSNTENLLETKRFALRKYFSATNWTYMPEMAFIRKNITDFISQRNVKAYCFNQLLSKSKKRSDNFIQNFMLFGQLLYHETKNLKSFWGIQLKSELELMPFTRTKLHLKSSHGRFYKGDWKSGIILGGTDSGPNSEDFHGFYGISYSDIFGNQITTLRAQIDFNILNCYRGHGLFPLFIREIHLLTGMDYVKADLIYMDKTFLVDEKLTSLHFGMKFMTTFAYHLPLELDLIYTRVQNPYGKDPCTILALFRGSIAP